MILYATRTSAELHPNRELDLMLQKFALGLKSWNSFGIFATEATSTPAVLSNLLSAHSLYRSSSQLQNNQVFPECAIGMSSDTDWALSNVTFVSAS